MRRRRFLGALGSMSAVGAMTGAPLLQGCSPALPPSLPPGRLLGDALNLATACARTAPKASPRRARRGGSRC